MRKQKKITGIMGLIVTFRLLITIPILISSVIMMFLENIICAFACLFVVVAIIVGCRVVLDDRFDRWKAERLNDDDD